ncbi:MAG: DUF1499 domain-containing protein [Gammaproteobacteria bacterium]|nr:DUF1499 domain-containing protein [Gammaproteobacteria bacterium]
MKPLIQRTSGLNFVCSQKGTSRYHYIRPLSCSEDPAATFAQVKDLIYRMPRTVILEATDEYIHALCRSPIFQFPDDLKCLLCMQERVIHVCSASRFGYHDLWVNRARVERLRRKLKSAQGQALPAK